MGTNNFLPFCPTDSGTNLLTQSEYAVASGRDVGNQPGVASSKLNNKAIRQANFITSQLAQVLADSLGTDVLDQDNYESNVLAQMKALTANLPAIIKSYTSSGANTYTMSYVFFIASGSATAGATYTNNAVTFTVSRTVSAQEQVIMTGAGDPLAAGTLTKASGTGDATITFYAFRKPVELNIVITGGGAGGGSVQSSGGANGNPGGDSSFGSLITVSGGFGGSFGNASGSLGGGAGGNSGTITAPAWGVLIPGGDGAPGANIIANSTIGSNGGCSYFGGLGQPGQGGANGADAKANTGSGGGGAGGLASAYCSSAGGGAGQTAIATIPNPSSTYAITIGALGAGGVGANGSGGAGADGICIVTERFQ